jgi:uncharacterized membrane protein YvlD (DUF360 family)
MFGNIASVWSELIAAVVAAVLAWFTKTYLDKKKNAKR